MMCDDTFLYKLDYCQQQQHMHIRQNNKQIFSSNISQTTSCRLAKQTTLCSNNSLSTCTADTAVRVINQQKIALVSAQHSNELDDLLHLYKSG